MRLSPRIRLLLLDSCSPEESISPLAEADGVTKTGVLLMIDGKKIRLGEAEH